MPPKNRKKVTKKKGRKGKKGSGLFTIPPSAPVVVRGKDSGSGTVVIINGSDQGQSNGQCSGQRGMIGTDQYGNQQNMGQGYGSQQDIGQYGNQQDIGQYGNQQGYGSQQGYDNQQGSQQDMGQGYGSQPGMDQGYGQLYGGKRRRTRRKSKRKVRRTKKSRKTRRRRRN